MGILATVAEKCGSVGSIVSAMGCAACFPALGSLAATIGLGFLASYEGIFINTLLPVFAGLALFANLVNWYQHRVHFRGLISVFGPIAVLATLYPLWQYGWSTYLLYSALALMLMVSILDIVKPAKAPLCRA
jgi:mercuric ion transport protein